MKWEYAVLTRVLGWDLNGVDYRGGAEYSCSEAMNLLGEEGWELVSVENLGDIDRRFYFKRPVP